MPTANIKGYVTNLGLLFQLTSTSYPYYSSLHKGMFINGVPAETIENLKTLKNETWYRLPDTKEITSVKHTVASPRVQNGWTLHDPKLASEHIPLNLSMTDLYHDVDEEDDEWGGKYASLHSLYTPTYAEVKTEVLDIEFTFQSLGEFEISNFNKPEQMMVTMRQDGGFSSDKDIQVELDKVVHFYQIEELLTPSFLLHTRPCYLTSRQVYQIVRSHIKSIYDPKKFKITSDYDFCFTVKKIIKVKPFTDIVSQSVKKGRGWTSKHVKVEVTQKEVEVFAMTWAGYNGKANGYDGYTPIDGWKANSVKELHDKIKEYLDDLTVLLLTDTKECECCKGYGHIVDKIATNQRK